MKKEDNEKKAQFKKDNRIYQISLKNTESNTSIPNVNEYCTDYQKMSTSRSPLSNMSKNMLSSKPSIKQGKSKTSDDLKFDYYKQLIRKSTKKLLSLSENANDSKLTNEQYESEFEELDIDSEYSEDVGINSKDNFKEYKEFAINFKPLTEKEIEQNKIFDEHYKKFYMPATENVAGLYDLYVTNSLKLVSIFDPKEAFETEIKKIKKLVGNSLKFDEDKPLLVLDLDETLIHSDLECKYQDHDHYIESSNGIIPINLRPNLYEFLDFCEENFEIIIFTASCKNYADPIIDLIEAEKNYFIGRFYRDHCIQYKNFFLKDLSIFNKDLSQVFLVDNCIFSFAHYLRNGVLITSYYKDEEDLDLLSLVEFFKASIIDCKDIREELDNTFEFNKICNSLKQVKI